MESKENRKPTYNNILQTYYYFYILYYHCLLKIPRLSLSIYIYYFHGVTKKMLLS